AQFARERVQAGDMPIGVRDRARHGRQPLRQAVGEEAAVVRQADQQRLGAAMQLESVHGRSVARCGGAPGATRTAPTAAVSSGRDRIQAFSGAIAWTVCALAWAKRPSNSCRSSATATA